MADDLSEVVFSDTQGSCTCAHECGSMHRPVKAPAQTQLQTGGADGHEVPPPARTLLAFDSFLERERGGFLQWFCWTPKSNH